MESSHRTEKDLLIFQIVVALILVSTWLFNFLIFKNFRFFFFQGFILLIIFISFKILMKMINTHLNKASREIVSYIDQMLNEHVEENHRTSQEDTVFGIIENKVFQLYDSIKSQKLLISKNREILQSTISDVSHQLKTPLSSIKLSVDYLITQNQSSDKKMYLDVLKFETNKIAMLTDYLVNSSRLEIGMIQPEKKYGNFYDMLVEVIQSALVHSKKLNQEIFFDCPKDTYFYFDTKWTKEAISNILENAIKYTPDQGKISIVVSQNTEETIIQIQDTGIGISEKDFGIIFKRFGRVSSNNYEGLGIGLYLANKIVKLQGGYILVKSILEVGSIFEIHMTNKCV